MSDDNPQRRATRRYTGTTTDFVLDGTTGRLTTATSSDQLTHVDLRVGKHGSTLAGLTEALSTAITTGLQAGAPPSEFVASLRHTHYTPSGTTTDPDVPHATSLSDYLAHRLHRHASTAPPHPDDRQLTGDVRTSTQPLLPAVSWVPHPRS
ncbi:TSCPD domain-containing protein [Micromonospora chokoriensis]